MHRIVLSLFGITIAATTLLAQDPFEIEVYQYETLAPGAWELETHLNYTALGTVVPDGTVAPSEHQAHLTVEAIRGLSPISEVAGYVLTAYRPDGGGAIAGARGRLRVRAPEGWHLPVGLAVNAEFSAMRRAFNHSSAVLEFAPSIEKRLGRWQLDANLAFGRDLNGPDSDAGWEFEPSARVGVDVSRLLTLTAAYFAGLGHLWRLDPLAQQVHQFHPGFDLRLGEDLHWSAGVGIGATGAGRRLVFTTSFEMPLGEQGEAGRSQHQHHAGSLATAARDHRDQVRSARVNRLQNSKQWAAAYVPEREIDAVRARRNRH